MKHLRYTLFILLSTLLSACPVSDLWAQAVKNITVSNDEGYTDHVSLKADSRDMDLMVKFRFNEQTNTLSVDLISYRDLFVFPSNTPCKQAVRRRKINPDKLPFVVDTEPGTTYQLAKDYWKSLPQPRSKHVFKKWIETTDLTPQPVETRMVNDFVHQEFFIDNKADAAELTLHDVLMMEQEAATRPGKKKYDIVWGNDINTTYRIYIKRNPCFGLDEELAAADNLLNAIRTAYTSLHSRYASGVVDDKESLLNFQEMKQLLATQYPGKKEKTPCPDLQDKWTQYNLYVDSIAALQCRIRPASTASAGGSGVKKAHKGDDTSLNAGYILTQARQIDMAVSRWKNTRDVTERADIKKQCAATINMVKKQIGKQKGHSASLQRAIAIFHQAANYYYAVCR